MRYILSVLLTIFALNANAGTVCHGQMPNFISDICWDCAFPIKLFGVKLSLDSGEDYNSNPSTSLICACTENMVSRTGFPASFWEYARQVDVTRSPYCMVSLGMDMSSIGVNADMYGAQTPKNVNLGPQTVFRHAHIYVNPLMGMMQVALDSKCLEPKGFDLFWMSELDPTWSDEEMARLLTPDAYLFGNIASTLACAADCVAASASLDAMSDWLYWCAGCNGELYPLDGYAKSIYGGVQMSSLITQRVMAKMHRMLLVPTMAGPAGMCNSGVPQITMDKQQYKYSMIYPIAQATPAPDTTAGSGGFMGCCQPFGRSTLLWGAGREFPIIGEDFAYGVFRKRDCCQ